MRFLWRVVPLLALAASAVSPRPRVSPSPCRSHICSILWAIVCLCTLYFLLCTPAWAVAPTVTSVQAHQWQDESRKVEINYTLTDPDSASVYVSVAISNDGGSTYSITPTSITGDTGWVRPGGRRTIIWDVKAQCPGVVWSSCKAKVTADDASGGVYPGEMIYIPAGSFLMGTNHNRYNDENQEPQHSVYLSSYWIGKYEVTRGEYRQFMNAGGYSHQAYWSTAGWSWKTSRTEPYYWAANQNWGTGTFTQTDNHPVVGASYYEAEAFCNWAGGHLATEAQWEKAARWTGSYPNTFPWGNEWNYQMCNNYHDWNEAGGGGEKNQTAPVGSYPWGVSTYGLHDMAGNVWEWCRDWYGDAYYSQTPPGGWVDPQGPASGSYRVLRGGSWDSYYYNYDYYYCAYRLHYLPSSVWGGIGFRLSR